jgi:hypothetical protein
MQCSSNVCTTTFAPYKEAERKNASKAICSRNNLIKFSSSKGLFPQPGAAKQTHSKTPTQQQACLANCTLCDRNNNLSLAPLVCLSNYKSRQSRARGLPLCNPPSPRRKILQTYYCKYLRATHSSRH